MRLFRALALAWAAVASGCTFHLPGYDLTASVEGVVGRADIHAVVGNHYASHSETHFWANFAGERGQLLRVRISTSKDIVSFADRKGLLVRVEWRFCDDLGQDEVHLGASSLFFEAAAVDRRGPAPIADERGWYGYDAILYVRDARPAQHRWEEAIGVFAEAYDLGLEPRDVCVQLELVTMTHGYLTNFARIPKEEIAAALGVPAGRTNAPVSEERAGEALTLCVDEYEQARGRPLPEDVDRAHIVVVEDTAEVWFARNPLGRFRRLGSRPADEAIDPICGVVVRPDLSVASVREKPTGPDEEALFERSVALRSHVDEKLDGYRPGSRRAAKGGSAAVEMLFFRKGTGFEFDRKMRWSEAEEIRHRNELAWQGKERRELAKRARALGSDEAVRFCAAKYERLAGQPLPADAAKAYLHVNERTGAMVVLFVIRKSYWIGAASGRGVLAKCRILGGPPLTIRHVSDQSRVLLGEPEGNVEEFGDICLSYLRRESEFIRARIDLCEYHRRRSS